MRWVAVVLLSGCSSILGIDDFKLGDAGGGEMMGDGGGGYCLGPTGWRVCLTAEPTNAPVMISSSLMFDTTSSPLCAPQQPASWKAAGQPDACFIISTQVTFAAPIVQAIGGRPLVVFASDSITVSTQLDVASRSASPPSIGPASPSMMCTPPMAAVDNTAAASGGAGGSFMTKGGDGGNSSAGPQGGRASAANAQAPTILRAGCEGGRGGNATEQGGLQGAGGGAVYLVAGNRITINGFINASGSAGRGGGRLAGGGGGGSGGMIHLHAPAIAGNAGVLVANGGAGGGGGGNQQLGASGADPTPQMPQMIAIGGSGGSGGGAGGNGFAGTTLATIGANGTPTTAAAGGGGGGASGFIRANIALSQITTSPAVTVVP